MSNMLEIKHQVEQVLSIRTRGAATLMPGDGPLKTQQILAKAGVSVPFDESDQNQYIVDLFFNREPGQKTLTRPFISVREQWVKAIDVFKIEREITLNYEYDFKRRPVNPRMVKVGDIEHLAFDSVPWSSLDERERAAVIFKNWRRTRCLKTMEDWSEWEDYYLTVVALEKVRKTLDKSRLPFQVTNEGSVGILKRIFLRAYAKGAWGLARTLTNKQLLEQMGSLGFPVTPHDAKNGHKGKLMENVVPRTPRNEDLLNQLKNLFDGMEEDKFFILD